VCPATPLVFPFPTVEALTVGWKTGRLPGGEAPGDGEKAVDYPKGAPIMIRRELLRNMNYLDARFGNFWSDLEMCSRIRGGGKRILVMSDVAATWPQTEAPSITDLEWTDSAHGIATWIGLHFGFAAGLKFRVSAALHALGRGKISVFTGIITGQKIDGNQE
jgi:hypothetical protein